MQPGSGAAVRRPAGMTPASGREREVTLVPEKKRFLLRIDPVIYDAIQRWAADEWRSVNGQIEYLLREALRRAGRLPAPVRGGRAQQDSGPPAGDSEGEGGSPPPGTRGR
ncbi:hypothetical protein Tmar_0389 [Thermaerobacter marianensis DSM 12885]|uniref:Arc-like DNA binding domain-containing protein n=1 Tax=Thermaerobacter marianensis (strain ATCC 700841 / DSM 12885 / JCM 10246 / 7p75a) TaxID=644966 RepID=E6SG95_THEM7|nr:hypothetical protein Tmar_0389 [Thermaerobacter marianensis DSM 12885]